MKKLLTITVAVMYLLISSGLVLRVHYCMGEMAGISLSHVERDTCGTCGMDNHGCCHDHVKVIKLSDEHFSASPQLLTIPKAEILQPATLSIPAFFLNGTKTACRKIAHSPPVTNGPPLHLLHCVFRI